MRIPQVLRANLALGNIDWSGRTIDLLLYSLLLLLCCFQLTHYLNTSDFVNDATYPDLAKSILEHGSYEIRFIPETTLPPGFAFLLALFGRIWGLNPSVLFAVIAL